METILYNIMNGSQSDFTRQTVTANNLANINTPGFKADLYNAQSMYMSASSTEMTAMSVDMPLGNDFSDGELITTGRDLDLAVQGKGWFAVQDGGGKEAYTRAGDFKLTENGLLVTSSGRPVLGDGGPISIPPAQRINIGTDGTISIVPLDGAPNELAVLDRIKLVKAEFKDLIKGSDGLMRLNQGGKATTDPSITVIKGALENSNVNAVEQMVSMITAGREFDAHMKVMQTVDENAQRLAQLLHE
ncbi:flagellar basal-body rod protein FlgF [Legionella spiritensis]|uniref:flagellar basal-body rod protein FlgF n=1 Tax=Legionella spiritensis TaxID=452 RepID=UPI000F7129BA|nr:flagellar basal-body rod protein FlgF [Legionella spiritensis]VEG89766.1 flagellar basal-body rod protein FlgF [Legionella spiritensis]